MGATITNLSPAQQGLHRNTDEDLANKGVNPYLLSYNDTIIDPIHALNTLRNEFESLPTTAKAISLGDIRDEFDADNNPTLTKKLDLLCEFLGSWRALEQAGAGVAKYINPNYTHIQHLSEDAYVTDPDERLRIMERCAAYGSVSLTELAPRFNLTAPKLAKFALYHDFDWIEHREKGRARLAHTCLTLRDWGYDMEQVASALGYTLDRLAMLTEEYRDPMFMPPTDPTN
jgi:hypothetical protein